MIKAILIDDETTARLALRQEIQQSCPEIEIIAEAATVEAAIHLLSQLQVQLVFLDVQLSDGSGFDILEKIERPEFKVIFTTAHSHYALRAIKFSALDYLLKPIAGPELRAAVRKVQVAPIDVFQQQLSNLLHQRDRKPQRIALATADGIHLYELSTIIRCTADGNYTRIFFTNGQQTLVAKTLKGLEELLQGQQFERIHKSHIINIDHLRSYLTRDNGQVVLSDRSILQVAQRKKAALLQRLHAFNE